MRIKPYTILLVVLLIMSLPACKEHYKETSGPIAILGAFSDEIKMLTDSLENARVVTIGGIQFTRGWLEGKDVVVVYTGIGKVNAAMTATLTVDYFKPSEVIFTGIAGGLNPCLEPTDIVVAIKCVQHDLNYVYNDSVISYPVSNPITGKVNPVFYKSDSGMLKILKENFLKIKLKSYEIGDQVYQPKIMTGIIATGDAFIASETKKEELINRFQADAVEMEGAAVAQVCYQNNIPFILIRSISDSADENADLDIEKFLSVASENANRVVIQLLKSMQQTD